MFPEEKLIGGADLVVDFGAPIVVRARLALAIHIVIEVAREIRRRHQRESPLGHSAEPVLGNLVVAERFADETALAIGGLLFWLTVPWGYWIDRHREPRQ